MDNVGAEVGQKMRSAVKAKLMELGCYVDDELPDYIMVMIANKRSKSQMNQDLELFLNNKTEAFVDWLHIVLRKLEEITVTNTNVLKRLSKRKSVKIKKEKKRAKKEPVSPVKTSSPVKSLTDDLPVKANKLAEVRKIVIMKESGGCDLINSKENVVEDNFDIPPLSEVPSERELAEIEKQIKDVRSRLGPQLASGSEDEDYINLKADPEDLFTSDAATKEKQLKDELLRKISQMDSPGKDKSEHPRIVFGNEPESPPVKKVSVLERLGKRPEAPKELKRKRMNLTETRLEDEGILGLSKVAGRSDGREERDVVKEVPRESALRRLSLKSKVAVPPKNTHEEETNEIVTKEVPSAVKVKPRTHLSTAKQANRLLLLKAVAEAQMSVAQTPVSGSNKYNNYTKKFRETATDSQTSSSSSAPHISTKNKNVLRKILEDTVKREQTHSYSSDSDDNLQYIPKPIKRPAAKQPINNNHHSPEYVPTRDPSSDENNPDTTESYPKQTKNQTFIITLDGITRAETPVSRKRKAPSPIVFDSLQTSPVASSKLSVPDQLPSVALLKTKERCKFWPTCRHGENCDFVHPSMSCRAFPHCKFGEKCVYLHPNCKFEASCTRKDCPYDHAVKASNFAKSPQMCRFYPNCGNIHCLFYHPVACKYGQNCKNVKQCSFSHSFPSKNSFTWRSAAKS